VSATQAPPIASARRAVGIGQRRSSAEVGGEEGERGGGRDLMARELAGAVRVEQLARRPVRDPDHGAADPGEVQRRETGSAATRRRGATEQRGARG
jgi:hypothetical protein